MTEAIFLIAQFRFHKGKQGAIKYLYDEALEMVKNAAGYELYGNVSDEVRKFLAQYEATFYRYNRGFQS